MNPENRSRWAGTLLAGLVLGSAWGCGGSAEPVVNDEARALQVQEVKAQADANDKAAKQGARPRSNVGVMPP